MIIRIPPPSTLRRFGLTEAQYRLLYDAGSCPICLKRFGYGPRAAVIDHDHQTFEVRGVICSACNYWLGTLHDNAGKLARAASYLTAPPSAAFYPVPRLLDSPPRQGD